MKSITAASASKFLSAGGTTDRDDRKYRIYSCRGMARLSVLEPAYPIETVKSAALGYEEYPATRS
ncbi:hypothetical protein [Methylophaga sp. OBS1]|uniref:hypothetical protein n=1 Tax=Methylophaga sp. OBS1 TaxID=2991933 RepID=UPI0022542020|nr:hypothetical protein [Methylophaga sp. OBS1]MCX4191167.1 hypothetical protein [Methylophaga sp. OBS1]MCX4191887.1 hypothetical protein [Methylophaga sp. OBS1]